jgi:two-component system OmpR family sensor kinase
VNLLAFLLDRLFLIVVYLINVVLSVLVIELDLLQSNLFLRKENMIYLFVLSITLLVVYLAIDFLRQWPFYREWQRTLKAENPSRVLHLQSAATKEQKAMQNLVQQNYREHANRLVNY